MKCYIVGGAVRDILMGRKPQDADMAFSGSIQDFIQAYPHAQQVGKSVQVWIVDGHEYMPLYNNCLSADLGQRDLTINALALDEMGHIFAHPLAFFDIKNKLLRPTSTQAFFQDPTRIFRLARFAATYPCFAIHKDALKQAQAVVQAKKHFTLPAERVGREILKALQTPCPARFFHVLQDIQAFDPWFTELHVLFENNPQALRQWGQVIEKNNDRYFSAYELALYRWMILGAFWDEKKYDVSLEHPIAKAGQKLCLPLAYTKAALCMVELADKARRFTSLSYEMQVHSVLKVHKQGLSKFFWAALDQLWPHASRSQHALAVLEVLLKVHLPLQWQDKGAASGEKLLQLQIEALEQTFHNYPK